MQTSHNVQELRSLKMHRIVEKRYREDPVGVVIYGLENLQRWKQKGVDCDDFRIWEEILRFSPQRLPELLGSFSEEAVRLRQSSPFAGLVPEESRQAILSAVE
jgi:hypothetical protein